MLIEYNIYALKGNLLSQIAVKYACSSYRKYFLLIISIIGGIRNILEYIT